MMTWKSKKISRPKSRHKHHIPILLSDSDKERFWSMVCKGDDCWIWTGATGGRGYGRFALNGRLESPHVISYILANGQLEPGMWVLHRCDNPSCVNPAHLFPGTNSDNMKDAYQKGRVNPPHPGDGR